MEVADRAVTSAKVAYFSMEISLEPGMPTYSGGLGVLAGDTIRSAADLRIPMVAVTLLHRKGYFYQRLGDHGQQSEEPVEWPIDDFLQKLDVKASVTIEGQTVHVGAWKHEVEGISGFKVPVYFLDTSFPENQEWHRTLTDSLYGGDSRYRLCQEVILGIGGVRMLRALGYDEIVRCHMNEGHASFLILEMVRERLEETGREMLDDEDLKAIREKCVFTTHTPVLAGLDKFPIDSVEQVLGDHPGLKLRDHFCRDDAVNMTFLALAFSHYVNGVAKKHGEVSRLMYAPYTIDSITNGVHVRTWASEPFQALFDKYIPGWEENNLALRYAVNIPRAEVWQAHTGAKRELIEYVNRETNEGMDRDVLTLGFARRATAYKRGDLLFHNIERLRRISREAGVIQVVYGGKAHPRDEGGKEIIKKIFAAKAALSTDVRVAYLANYGRTLGALITAGVDLWLNTPQPPMEASGTSGMKAALNGVPSLSVLDGWWLEGHIEGVTGWSIGENQEPDSESRDREQDANSLYQKLEKVIIPVFYRNRNRFIDIMRNSIALNGSFFNTQRMMQQYVLRAYFL